MIVRIFSEGQYELPEAALAGLYELDDQTQAAVDAGDEHGSMTSTEGCSTTSARQAPHLPATTCVRRT